MKSSAEKHRSTRRTGSGSTDNARSGLRSVILHGRIPSVSLVKTWLQTYLRGGKSKADALRDLNASLGTKYDSSHLSRWERGERSPNSDARYAMLLVALPSVFGRCTRKEIAEAAERLR